LQSTLALRAIELHKASVDSVPALGSQRRHQDAAAGAGVKYCLGVGQGRSSGIAIAASSDDLR
jgi:hypothetical protein